MQITKEHGLDWLKWLVCLLLLVLSFTVFYSLMQRPESDLSIHATWASEGRFTEPRSFVHHTMHPAWHAMVALLLRVGLALPAAAALVTTLLKAAEFLLMHGLSRALLGSEASRPLVTGCALCAVLVGSLRVPGLPSTLYMSVGTANTWHSPTQLIAMVAMLFCVPLTASLYADFERRLPIEGGRAMVSWKRVLLLAAALLISLVCKPTFMQAFLPAACIFFLIQWIRHPKNSRYFGQMIVAALPSVLFMGFQYLYYFGIIVPWQGSMILLVNGEKIVMVLLGLLFIQAFPLYVLCTEREPHKLREPLLSLTLLMDAFGVLEQLLLSENGRRASDGNFSWAMMGGALMLWAVVLPRFIKQYKVWRAAPAESRTRVQKARYIGGFALLSWHLISGIYYIVYLLTTTNPL